MKRIKNINIIMVLIPLTILLIISVLNMMSASYISDRYSNYFIKQIIWIIAGFIIMIIVSKIKPTKLFKYSKYSYWANILLLLLVLFLGSEINGTTAWFDFRYFSYQPSETMKLTLILYLADIASRTKLRNMKLEVLFICKILILTLIPAVLTFLEPDTGAVIIYLFIMIGILLASKINNIWLIVGFIIATVVTTIFFYLYNTNQDLFIKLFGTTFFYRMDRIFDFGSGMQIENALIAIGSAGWFGIGIKNTSIYFPESPTDFVYALSISNFGFIGGIIIIACYLVIFILLFSQIRKTGKLENKFFIVGFLLMFIFQVAQNILMNLGLMPIMGITLPLISYGGTSTILYFLALGIVLTICYKQDRYSF